MPIGQIKPGGNQMTPKMIEKIVIKKIKEYHPRGHLGFTVRLILILCGIFHKSVKIHLERVALFSERTAEILGEDKKAAFFGGVTHDVGKIALSFRLFDGHDINAKEYSIVKKHAVIGFKILKKLHYEFIAVCAGLHHGLYRSGYGITINDIPKKWNTATIKKAIEISTIVSICDFIDAFTHRTTKILDGSNRGSDSLLEMLLAKFPNDIPAVHAAIQANKDLSL